MGMHGILGYSHFRTYRKFRIEFIESFSRLWQQIPSFLRVCIIIMEIWKAMESLHFHQWEKSRWYNLDIDILSYLFSQI